MDGQGRLSDETIASCLCLTNLALIQFNRADLSNESQRQELHYVLDTIKESPVDHTVVLLIRDAYVASVIKTGPESKMQLK